VSKTPLVQIPLTTRLIKIDQRMAQTHFISRPHSDGFIKKDVLLFGNRVLFLGFKNIVYQSRYRLHQTSLEASLHFAYFHSFSENTHSTFVLFRILDIVDFEKRKKCGERKKNTAIEGSIRSFWKKMSKMATQSYDYYTVVYILFVDIYSRID